MNVKEATDKMHLQYRIDCITIHYEQQQDLLQVFVDEGGYLYPGAELNGFCDMLSSPMPDVYLDAKLKGISHLSTLIHEWFHACYHRSIYNSAQQEREASLFEFIYITLIDGVSIGDYDEIFRKTSWNTNRFPDVPIRFQTIINAIYDTLLIEITFDDVEYAYNILKGDD